jgi:hypothetical protein
MWNSKKLKKSGFFKERLDLEKKVGPSLSGTMQNPGQSYL